MKLQEIKVDEGRRLSFFQLFSTEGLNIEIPIIQRDYAQGRKSAQEVRTEFLSTLYDYLDQDEPNRDLDFVYGSIKRSSDEKTVLTLLDGQQRITTLFLLHWYLAMLSGNLDTLRKRLLDEKRSRFTYETRASAREFCNALLLNDIVVPATAAPISEAITDAGWYFQLWKYDPTIQSMLTMIDAIENRFRNRPDFFARLIREEDPVITFQFLDIGELHLTDDLYIKMNSRGRALTPFENFKAKLEKEIGELFLGSGKKWQFHSGDLVKQMSSQEYFSHNIDTKWIDFFWSRNYNNRKKDFPDANIMNFMRIILTNQYAIDGIHTEKERFLRILLDTQDARKDADYTPALSFHNYQEWGTLTRQSIIGLISSFDCLLLAKDLTPLHIPAEHHYDHQATLSKVFNHELGFSERVRFHGFLRYIIEHKDTGGLRVWMRVLYNLTENTDFDDAEGFASALREVEKMLPHAPAILRYLAQANDDISAFYGRQIEEEQVKACLILKSTTWEDLIYSIEKHSFARGQIGFLLEFSGILDYHKTNGNCDWNKEENDRFLTIFQNYVNKSSSLFNYLIKRNNSEELFLWERAVLTKGEYMINATYWRKNFLHTNANTRDYSWKRLLRLNSRQDAGGEELNTRRKLVKAVFDDSRFDHKAFHASCERIIADVPSAWWAPFVLNPRLISVCEQGFIRRDDFTGKVRLLTTSKLTYHYELMTFDLFINKIENKTFPPFSETAYQCDYGESGIPKITLRGMMCGNNHYGIDILYTDNLWINFKLLDEDIDSWEKYDGAIVDALKSAGFSDMDTERGGYSRIETAGTALERLKMLCGHLQVALKLTPADNIN